MDFASMSSEQLVAILDDMDRERSNLRERAKAVMNELRRKLVLEQADEWGLTPEQYRAAKVESREAGKNFGDCLKAARKKARQIDREVQTVVAEPANVGITADKV